MAKHKADWMESALPVSEPEPSPKATHLYTTLMGISYPRGGQHAYVPGGEMIELTEAEAKPLLAMGAIEVAK